jgi:TRAP-type C4-dicarboxylate transport system substrate-binding protein
MSVAQMHDAMKDGRIDMAMTGIASVLSREMWKVSDIITRTAYSLLAYLLIMTEKNWQARSPVQGAAIQAAVKRLELKIRERVAENERQVYSVAREKGMKIVNLAQH